MVVTPFVECGCLLYRLHFVAIQDFTQSQPATLPQLNAKEVANLASAALQFTYSGCASTESNGNSARQTVQHQAARLEPSKEAWQTETVRY